MKACECCQRSLPDDSAPQRRYCGRADCKRGRDAYRKAHQRAGAYNALTCVVSPLPERPKRKTSSTHNPAGDHEDDLNFDSGEITSRWDEISRAWQAANVWRPTVDLPANRGLPALDERGRRIGKLIDLDRLMGEAERAVRPLIARRGRRWASSMKPTGPVKIGTRPANSGCAARPIGPWRRPRRRPSTPSTGRSGGRDERSSSPRPAPCAYPGGGRAVARGRAHHL
jgi:hypothetical protein